jgi:hypothetical protein
MQSLITLEVTMGSTPLYQLVSHLQEAIRDKRHELAWWKRESQSKGFTSMTDKQVRAFGVLQRELRSRRGIRRPLPDCGESDEGFLFTEVEGVTVIIGRGGGYQLPTVHTYHKKALDAAVYADDEWKKQDSHSSSADHFKTGHLSPVVDIIWRCGSKTCPCASESYDQRLKRSIAA